MPEISLPLFPLNTVLMPGFPLALNVFEARYLVLVEHCVERGCPFAVAMIQEGTEVGEPANPYAIGTMVDIVEIDTLPGGRYHIVVVGRQRIRIQEVLPPSPYLQARASVLPVDETTVPGPVRESLYGRVREYVSLMTGLSDAVQLADIPEAADSLCWLLATMLQVPLREKQWLLEENDSHKRINALLELYRRELDVVRHVIDNPGETLIRPFDADRPYRPVSRN